MEGKGEYVRVETMRLNNLEGVESCGGLLLSFFLSGVLLC